MSKLSDTLAARAAGVPAQTKPAGNPLLKAMGVAQPAAAAPVPEPAKILAVQPKESPLAPLSSGKALPDNPMLQTQVNLPLNTNSILQTHIDISSPFPNGANQGPISPELLAGIYRDWINKLVQAINLGDVTDVMYQCMTFIDNNLAALESEKLIIEDDIGIITKALQLSHGAVLVKKQENKTKRGVKKDNLAALDGELAALFGNTPAV